MRSVKAVGLRQGVAWMGGGSFSKVAEWANLLHTTWKIVCGQVAPYPLPCLSLGQVPN